MNPTYRKVKSPSEAETTAWKKMRHEKFERASQEQNRNEAGQEEMEREATESNTCPTCGREHDPE